MRIAVVTGASSRLGMVFTEAIVNKYKDLDEIWIIARRKELDAFSKTCGDMNMRVLAKNEMTQSKKVNRLPFLNLKIIVERSLDKAQKRKATYTLGKFYKYYRSISEILPSGFMIKFTRNFYTDRGVRI